MDARAVVRADAVFEGALGATLVVGTASNAIDFPSPIGAPVVYTVGVLLLTLGVVLWRAQVGLAPLAAGNVVTAVAGVAWLAATSGFSDFYNCDMSGLG